MGEGGHNWTTNTPRLKLDPTVPRGQVSPRAPDGNYRVHPADLPGLVVRGPGEAPLLGKAAEPRSMTTTLGAPERFTAPDSPYSWRPSPAGLSAQERADAAAVRKGPENAVCVFAQADGSYRVSTPRAEFEARTHKELMDVLLDATATRTIDVELRGVTADQAYALRMTLLPRRGIDRPVQLTREHPAVDGRPETFDSTAYTAGMGAIKGFTIVGGRGKLELELAAKQGGMPAARVNVVIRAGTGFLNFLRGAMDRVLGVISRALGRSNTPQDFHANFRREFEATFKDDLTRQELNAVFKDVKIEVEYLLRTQDQYQSRVTPDDRGAR